MEILTRRFLLRDFLPEDAPAFKAYHADPRSLEFYGAEQATAGHAGELLDLFRAWAAELPRRNYQLAIVRRDTAQTLVGCCGLRSADALPGTAELGIELAPDYWGRYKYATEVLQSLARFGFDELGLQEVFGSTVSANRRMVRLLESSGATTIVGITPRWMSANGWTQVEWRLARADWNSRLPATRR